jgi:hypothetical protein
MTSHDREKLDRIEALVHELAQLAGSINPALLNDYLIGGIARRGFHVSARVVQKWLREASRGRRFPRFVVTVPGTAGK